MPTGKLPPLGPATSRLSDKLYFTVQFPKGVSREVIEKIVRVHVGQYPDLSVRIDSAARRRRRDGY